jgi:hypothetical protein
MNVVSLERQAQILSALVEGNSVRSTSRMSGAHLGTILNLLVRAGNGCATLMDQTMHRLRCQRLEVDEIWPYVDMKQKQAAAHPEQVTRGTATRHARRKPRRPRHSEHFNECGGFLLWSDAPRSATSKRSFNEVLLKVLAHDIRCLIHTMAELGVPLTI